MDLRFLIIFSPLVVALLWVAFNIGVAALQQGKSFLNPSS